MNESYARCQYIVHFLYVLSKLKVITEKPIKVDVDNYSNVYDAMKYILNKAFIDNDESKDTAISLAYKFKFFNKEDIDV